MPAKTLGSARAIAKRKRDKEIPSDSPRLSQDALFRNEAVENPLFVIRTSKRSKHDSNGLLTLPSPRSVREPSAETAKTIGYVEEFFAAPQLTAPELEQLPTATTPEPPEQSSSVPAKSRSTSADRSFSVGMDVQNEVTVGSALDQSSDLNNGLPQSSSLGSLTVAEEVQVEDDDNVSDADTGINHELLEASDEESPQSPAASVPAVGIDHGDFFPPEADDPTLIDPDTWTDIFQRAYETPKGCKRSPSFVPEKEWEHLIHELPTFKYVLEREKYGEQLSRLIKKLSRLYAKEEWYAGLLVRSEEMVYTDEELLNSPHFQKLETAGKIKYVLQKFKGVKGKDMVLLEKSGKEHPLKNGENWRDVIEKQKEYVAKLRTDLLALKDSPLLSTAGSKKAPLPEPFHELLCLVSYAAFTDKEFQGVYGHFGPEVVENPPNDRGLVCLVRVMEKVFDCGPLTGITIPEWLYSTALSFFAWHREDYLMGSINTVHWTDGEDGRKLWLVLAPKDAPVLQEVVEELIKEGNLDYNCKYFAIGSHHKQAIVLVIERLLQRGVHVYYAMQGAGQTMVLSPGTPHMGGQLGANIASAVNFADLDLFVKTVLDRNAYVQCDDDKAAKERGEQHGFDNMESRENLEAIRRAAEEKLEYLGNPEYPTPDQLAYAVQGKHFLCQAEFQRVSNAKIVPELLREKFFTTQEFPSRFINSEPGIPGVRLPDAVAYTALADNLFQKKEVGKNAPDWELIGYIQYEGSFAEAMAAIRAGELKIDLLKGVQRFHAGKRLKRKRFKVTVYWNCSREEIQQIIAHEWAKALHKTLDRLGLEALEIIRDTYERTVKDHCQKNGLPITARPRQFYPIFNETLGPHRTMYAAFKKDFKERLGSIFPCMQRDILTLHADTSKRGDKVLNKFCNIAQLPPDSMDRVRGLYAALKDPNFAEAVHVQESKSDYIPAVFGKLMSPLKLSELLPDQMAARKALSSETEYFVCFNAAVDFIVKDGYDFRWACKWPNVVNAALGKNIVVEEKEKRKKKAVAPATTVVSERLTRSKAPVAESEKRAESLASEAASSLSSTGTTSNETTTTKTRKAQSGKNSNSGTTSKPSTVPATVQNTTVAAVKGTGRGQPFPAFDVTGDLDLKNLGLTYPWTPFSDYTDERPAGTAPLPPCHSASMLASSVALLKAQRSNQFFQIMQTAMVNEVRILQRFCHRPELVVVVKFRAQLYDPDPFKCVAKADLDVYGYFSPEKRQYECLGRVYNQPFIDSYVLVEDLMFTRNGLELEISDTQAGVIATFCRNAFIYDGTRFECSADGVQVPIFPPNEQITPYLAEVREFLMQNNEPPVSMDGFAPMIVAFSRCQNLAYHLTFALRSKTPLVGEEAIADVPLMAGPLFYAAFLNRFAVASSGTQNGNCLYQAVSVALAGTPDLECHVRFVVLAMLEKHFHVAGELAGLLNCLNHMGITFTSIVLHAVKDVPSVKPLAAHWGTLYILATVLARPIYVHDSSAGTASRKNPTEWKKNYTDLQLSAVLDDSSKGQVFNSLFRKSEPLAAEPLRFLYTGSKFYPVFARATDDLHRFPPCDVYPNEDRILETGQTESPRSPSPASSVG
ncbi:uncharacterized protein LOC129586065 [Paramacrobiotus metropolitanus]|uniref:uncharacterized protein LOC129586065 n=1 Tax=Paramacrobiotus metropolitanus TaxID=2943436 RepID=UPI002445A4F5|nr:uncharacterized protein LOC129586065 [Paramacrobiotus metropolitanus]XP_055335037.1 uncharacterized protein LOC129586065 [Paramacrobiotus metropolitanus]XP_055335038.1 uncharacterized protein LOC129586065 [Paramacrobiotus metropolitanus]